MKRPSVRWLGVALALYPLVPAADAAVDAALGLPLQLERLLLSMFVFALLALACHVQLGLGGMMQLGSAALYGLGAYTYGTLTVEKLPLQWPPWAALSAAAAVGAAVAACLGAVCARLRGDAVGMLTLAFAECWRVASLNAESITDGSRGLNPLPSPSWAALGPVRGEFVALYGIALALVAAATVGLEAWARGPTGRALTALRCDPMAAESVGLSIWRLQARAMALGGALAGAGGGLYAAYLTTTAEPNTYDFNVSVMALCAVVLGGLGSARGAVAGAAFVVAFDAALSPVVDALLQRLGGPALAEWPWAHFGSWRWLVFGGLLVATVLRRPEGLLSRRPR